MMITCNYSFRAVSMAALVFAALACDSGSPSRTPDEIAADSALASDLALANRDTLVVDSIGAYRAPDAAERDAGIDTAIAAMEPESIPPAGTTPAPAAPTRTTTAPAAPPAAAPAPAPTATAKPAQRLLTGTRACSSPLPANQSECVRVTLASTDMRLNRIYRALITEMRRQEKVAPGAKDPPSVQRLRVSQRSWLVYRDSECRRRGRRREGALWARPRVKCLGEFSVRRANELADNFSRLTAH
jgi:uncharacterized protein YecT (DUF1311 family)